jgi:hypothetical protein
MFRILWSIFREYILYLIEIVVRLWCTSALVLNTTQQTQAPQVRNMLPNTDHARQP